MKTHTHKKTIAHNKNTRANTQNMLSLPSHKNKYGKKTKGYLIPLFFNKLPPELKKFKRYREIKKGISKWIKEEE